jgi:hypothetical protein
VRSWEHKGKVISTVPEGMVGFTYCITNTTTGQQYIGKKSFWKISKGKQKTSNWQSYFGSSKELLYQVSHLGQDSFTREILNIYDTSQKVTYGELEEQVKRDVLRAKLPNGRPAYFNRNIAGKYFRGTI